MLTEPDYTGKARKFFVGGNFKSNGTITQIKSIIEGLNQASLNPNVGSLTIPFFYKESPSLPGQTKC